MPILGIHSLTKSLHDTKKWVFCKGTHRPTDKQTDGHGDSMTESARRADPVKRDKVGKTSFQAFSLKFILNIFRMKHLKFAIFFVTCVLDMLSMFPTLIKYFEKVVILINGFTISAVFYFKQHNDFVHGT